MATFLTGNQLNAEVEILLESATEHIILISPYIKIHSRFASTLSSRKKDSQVKIVVVFGKNDDDFSKSMKQDVFDFFKDFPNIEIRYEKRLHAKYYANESAAILTSMNLYDYSQDNNIEAGVLTSRKGILGSLTGQDSLDSDAADYFERVIDQAELLYLKKPVFESVMLGLTKRYVTSNVEIDKLTDYFSKKGKPELETKTGNYSPKKSLEQTGFCIRTGTQIPFNPKHPMSDAAFQSWKKFSNTEYPEKYCHFSGELSNGETSFSKPILRKNWAKAKR